MDLTGDEGSEDVCILNLRNELTPALLAGQVVKCEPMSLGTREASAQLAEPQY